MAASAGGREERLARAFEEAAVLMRHGSCEEAARRFRAALRLAPQDPDLHYNLGVALAGAGQHADAISSLRRALALRPGSADVHVTIGDALQALGRHAEALDAYMRALTAQPGFPEAHNNLGNALQAIGRFEDAVGHYQEAIAARPEYGVAHNNLGNALRASGRHEAALACYGRAREIAPDDAESYYQEAIARLRVGDYIEGWRLYEWRWRRPGFPDQRREAGSPLWLGREALAGKTILLYAEQGSGDTLQFLRYVPLVAARGASVILELQPALMPMAAALQAAARIVPRGAPSPNVDFHCPLMSLPHALGTALATVPVSVPYLMTPEERATHWRRKLAVDGRQLVGIAWRGNPAHEHGAARDLELTGLEPLLRTPGFRFVSLQKELSRNEQRWLAQFPQAVHLGEDFEHTGDLVAALDLVISVDSAWVHWAGAIGKPVWVLLASEAQSDWRWMIGRDDSPWYPTVRLFRQASFGDWPSAIARTAQALAAVEAR